MDYKQTAEKIIELVGGKENIQTHTHLQVNYPNKGETMTEIIKLAEQLGQKIKEDKIVKYLYLFGIREESLFRKMEEYRDAFNWICSEDLPELLDSCFRYKY